MKQVRPQLDTLGSDGTLASKFWPAGSIANLNDNHANYLLDQKNAFSATPLNRIAPTINVTTIANGGTITCNSNGTWEGDATITFTYQWYDGATIQAGKTSASIVTVVGDVGKNLKCRVTGTNSLGNSTADSSSCVVT